MTVDADQFLKRFQFTKKNYRDVYPALESSIVGSQVDKTVIVVGASQGIGKAIALAFAKASAKNLIIAGRSLAELEAAKSEILKINETCNVLVASVDATSEADVQKLERTVRDTFGHADILINNSGQWSSRGNIDEVNVNAWWGDFELNIKGTYLTTQSFLRLLPKSSQGSIITVGSLASNLVFPGNSSYVLTKLALNRFNEFIALENPNVHAVVFHPGSVLTPSMEDLEGFKLFALDSPELAGAFAVYLTTERAKYLNGKYASVNWDVEELEARREDIVSKGFFTEELKGVFSSVN
ncbi:hypothetical protein K443DRAFT_652959 [Laccaria amethystina LaAM-08-1]|uniref:NAD(P)-binding protein n=1 Tax=Laccaria amethystina LaAM-08-1 TaxID=1095629 RepID=A0A0C9Y0R5_9AGAR|nr:hypothetical protein K443DRAFT_652959 [Laccaria amethystina LaAM-08-1]